MKTKKLLVLVMAACLMSFVSCSDDDDDFSGSVNGVWNLVDSDNNRTGTIITISGDKGVITAIGEDDAFTIYLNKEQVNLGDTIIRRISYKGVWDGLLGDSSTVYWTCENYIPFSLNYYLTPPNVTWSNRYISYDTKKNDGIFIYTAGDPNMGFGFRFRK
ncbi:MAG: hypothetical protein FWF51_12425 [Chitinivibrionia bacterium]|nr:hypothetical protein [Chitinivibrionia bacterium]